MPTFLRVFVKIKFILSETNKKREEKKADKI